jgi:hypothetical protein
MNQQQGDGILLREAGKFPPADRKLIEEVGGEKVEKLTLFRYPISLSKFAKFIGALKNTPYDDLIHIGVVINGKYLTEKDAVLNFERAGVPSQSTDTLDVPLGTKSITINDLLENTRKRMGDERFSTYRALSWNCQDYLQNMLEANGVSTAETTKFIKQDLEQVVKNLPSFANAISNFYTGAKAVVNRLTKGEGDCQCGEGALEDYMKKNPDYKPPTLEDSGRRYLDDMNRIKKYYGYGEGDQLYNYQLHRAKCKFSEGQYGGADDKQRGEAALLREYVDDPTLRPSGFGKDLTLKQELQTIVHSADPFYNTTKGSRGQTYYSNYFKDYTNTFDPEAQKVIDAAKYYITNLQAEEMKPENIPPPWVKPIGDKRRNRRNVYMPPPPSALAGTSSVVGPAIGGTAPILTGTTTGKTPVPSSSKPLSGFAKGFVPRTSP